MQFETIHPFLDGNGRIGRLLIAALVEHWGLLPEPLLYVSGYLKQHQAEYYRRLSAVRTDGDWEGWVAFFLEGVANAAAEAERNIVAIATLLAADRRRLLASPKAGPASYRLFEMLPMMPRFTIEQVRQKLGCSLYGCTPLPGHQQIQGLWMRRQLPGSSQSPAPRPRGPANVERWAWRSLSRFLGNACAQV